jgi:hypothetical protein
LKLAIALVSLLALGAGACGELPNETTVQDLRVLGVMCEPAGFLVNLDDPGSATEAELTATLTALVVDPIGGGQELTVMGVGCPDYIDTITSATEQGSKLCPPASTTSQIPEPIGSKLATAPASGPPTASPIVPDGIEYNPTLSFGLRPDQVGAFFSPTPTGVPLLDASVALNRDFGLPAIVNLTFGLGSERVEAIKRVVYWPRLDPAQQPNKNPTMGGVRLYRHRDDATGNPIDEIDPVADPTPTVSVSAMDKLYVQPAYGPEIAESYLLRVKNVETMQIETRTIDRELVRFYFYASPAGTFDPEVQFSEENPITMVFHDDSEYVLPKPEKIPADGKVTIWIVAHDERAGTAWVSRTINVVP